MQFAKVKKKRRLFWSYLFLDYKFDSYSYLQLTESKIVGYNYKLAFLR